MPGFNWIPGVSQLKSVCQLLTGDVEGARQTQEDFFRECPGISQGVALGQLIAGDIEGAEETLYRGVDTLNNVVDEIPLVGHAKSGVHLICGDTEGASRAFQSATRSTVVMGTGVATGVLTGGIGAFPAAIAVGTTYDTVDTIISDRPKGVIAAVDQVAKNPNAGNIFDATAMIAGDGLD
ncbi:hypothetical protein TYRP_023706 [Tyrophagus putrescentiae]|nr:hypothetical protein TYRP_023706 [Tyrophagus putrescentiae]